MDVESRAFRYVSRPRNGALEHAERSEAVDVTLRVLIGQKQASVSASDTREETLQTVYLDNPSLIVLSAKKRTAPNIAAISIGSPTRRCTIAATDAAMTAIAT